MFTAPNGWIFVVFRIRCYYSEIPTSLFYGKLSKPTLCDALDYFNESNFLDEKNSAVTEVIITFYYKNWNKQTPCIIFH